jgi:hypothetical protein
MTTVDVMGRTDSVSGNVELSLPASPSYLYLARLHVGAIAARERMPIEDVEDLRLAVDELCLSLLNPRGHEGGRLHVSIALDAGRLEVRCRLLVPSSAPQPDGRVAGLPATLSSHILDALVDAHGQTIEDGDRVAWLTKRCEPVPEDR